jgi:hypothetical protein
LSKTTSAKIFAYSARLKNYSIKFPDTVEEIEKFIGESLVQGNKTNPSEWLLIIDDLHRSDFGTINKKIGILNPFLAVSNYHILIVSRVSLKQIIELCPDEREITN